MEHLVVDSSVMVASFLPLDIWHERSQLYINGLENGDYTFHLPMLVIVEIMAAISRQSQTNRQALLTRASKSLSDWEQDGKTVLYEFDRDRMDRAVNIARTYRFKGGADSAIAALAEELDIALKTFDMEVLANFQRATV